MHTVYAVIPPTVEAQGYRFTGMGGGDCDDLALTWATLGRALGLDTLAMGCGPRKHRHFAHAVGYYRGQVYELCDDRTYANRAEALPIIAPLPAGWRGYAWDPMRDQPVMRGPVDAGAVVGLLEEHGVPILAEHLGDKPREAVTQAAKLVATGASAAGSATSAALALGVSAAAVPVIGWVVAGAAVLASTAMVLAKVMKNRKRIIDRGNEAEAYAKAIERLTFGDVTLRPEILDTFRARLFELAAALAGNRGRNTPEGPIVNGMVVAHSSGAGTWSDGTTGRKSGIGQLLVGHPGEASAVANASVIGLKTLADSLSKIPRMERKAAMRLTIAEFLGDGAIGVLAPYLPTLDAPRTRAGQSATIPPVVPIGAAIGVALLLV